VLPSNTSSATSKGLKSYLRDTEIDEKDSLCVLILSQVYAIMRLDVDYARDLMYILCRRLEIAATAGSYFLTKGRGKPCNYNNFDYARSLMIEKKTHYVWVGKNPSNGFTLKCLRVGRSIVLNMRLLNGMKAISI